MAVGIVDRQKLVNIADAVRAKKGITGNMTLDAIASNITSMPTADNNAKFDFAGSASGSSISINRYLVSIDFNGIDTSNLTNMYALFSGYTKLENLDISMFNMSKLSGKYGSLYNTFCECSNLKSIVFPTTVAFDSESTMTRAFESCTSLTTLDLSSFNTTNVTDMSRLFYNCSSLTSLDLSNFDTSNVIDMNYMFTYCNSLITLDLSSFNTSNVTKMYGIFQYCRALKNVDVSGFNTSNITNMGYMFNDCTSLTSLDLSNWNTSKVISMNDMFYNCSKLSNLTLGNDWASNSSISSFSLSSCPLTRESAVDVINKLATRSNSPVITFSNKVGLYQSEIDVATNKGWSVSGCTVLV